jgi:hypothetical protein
MTPAKKTTGCLPDDRKKGIAHLILVQIRKNWRNHGNIRGDLSSQKRGDRQRGLGVFIAFAENSFLNEE